MYIYTYIYIYIHTYIRREEKGKEEFRLIKVQYIHRWNTMAKTFWALNVHINNEGQECKTSLVGGEH
jgi:hypothetical protein